MIYSDGIHIISDTSLGELHAYCQSIGIKKCWFHRGTFPHYDIPVKMRKSFFDLTKLEKVTPRDIVKILRDKNPDFMSKTRKP